MGVRVLDFPQVSLLVFIYLRLSEQADAGLPASERPGGCQRHWDSSSGRLAFERLVNDALGMIELVAMSP